MDYLVDGYNAMHAVGSFAGSKAPRGLQRARERFLTRLSALLEPESRGRTRVVFDAHVRSPVGTTQETIAGIQVLYATRYDEADDLLEELIRSHNAPRNLTVVSGDRRIQRAAERRRARALSAEAWLRELCEPSRQQAEAEPAAKPERPMSHNEVAFWLSVFEAAEERPKPRRIATRRPAPE